MDGAGWSEGVADQMPRMPRADSAGRTSTEAEPHGGVQVPELPEAHGGGVAEEASETDHLGGRIKTAGIGPDPPD